MMARRVSGSPSLAVEAATRKVVVSASSRPPPRAEPFIAEIVGIGRAVIEERVERRVERKSRVLWTELVYVCVCRE